MRNHLPNHAIRSIAEVFLFLFFQKKKKEDCILPSLLKKDFADAKSLEGIGRNARKILEKLLMAIFQESNPKGLYLNFEEIVLAISSKSFARSGRPPSGISHREIPFNEGGRNTIFFFLFLKKKKQKNFGDTAYRMIGNVVTHSERSHAKQPTR